MKNQIANHKKFEVCIKFNLIKLNIVKILTKIKYFICFIYFILCKNKMDYKYPTPEKAI